MGHENFEVLSPKLIWATVCFMDMGKNNYIVTKGSQTFFHETSISFRREPIPNFVKDVRGIKEKERNADVFKYWVKDTPELL